jgi:branched-chain amino acid transport system substrate-binding protein
MRKLIILVGLTVGICSSAFSETTVAAILPLTGNAAEQGEWARRGFDIAQQQLKESGQGDFKFIYEDSKGGDAATAVQAYKSIVHREKIPVVFTYGSGVGMALSPLTNTDQIIQMGIATATPKYRSEDDYTFRDFPSATLEANFLAETLTKKMAAKELAIININNDYGVGTSGAAESAFSANGGKVVWHESFNPGETDFRTMLLKLRGQPKLVVYLAVYPTDGALLLKQAREIGLSNEFIASVAIIGGKDFFSLAGKASEGMLVISTAGAKNSSFQQKYNSLYQNESPAQQIYAARAYDALMLISSALRSCQSENTGCMKDALSKIKNYPGASGILSFDTAGDVTTSFSLFKVHAQKFELTE